MAKNTDPARTRKRSDVSRRGEKSAASATPAWQTRVDADLARLHQAGDCAGALARMQTLRETGGFDAEGKAATCYIAGLCAFSLGELAQAEVLWREAVAAQADFFDAYNGLGVLYRRQRRHAEAEAAYRQAVAFGPHSVDLYSNFGNLLTELGQWDEAERLYRQAIALKPASALSLNNLGALLVKQQRFEEAEVIFRRALEKDPHLVGALNNLGIRLMERGELEEARACYQAAIRQEPGHADAHNNLGVLAKKQGHDDEAEASYRQALKLHPGFVDAYNNLGQLLAGQGRFAEAETIYRAALKVSDAAHDTWRNLGDLMQKQQRMHEAEVAYRRCLQLRPDDVDAQWNFSLLLLVQGRFAEGWPLYELRYSPRRHHRIIVPPDLPFPQWQGESLQGKTILLWPEQGLGDEIQFCRYVVPLRALGPKRIGLACNPAVAPLLRSLQGVDEVHALSEHEQTKGRRYDYWVFPLSLAYRMATRMESIPARLPYLYADSRRVAFWYGRLPREGFRVGLVWRGRTAHSNDTYRSLCGLSVLKPLWASGATFISLQKGAGEDEAALPPPDQPLINAAPDIQDFGDTAAIIAQLDLVITVDTSVAHVAGALGKPVWVLLPAVLPDWRWLLEREDSPWYPKVMRLFRQKSVGDWTTTITAVAEALCKRVAEVTHQRHDLDAAWEMPSPAQAARLYAENHPVAALSCAETALGRGIGRGNRQASTRESSQLHYVAGAAARALGQDALAEMHWLLAIRADPDFADAWNGLGTLFRATHRVDQAEKSYRRALAIQPEHAHAWNNLGNLMVLLDRTEEAEACMRQAVALEPQFPEAHYNLGLQCLHSGREAEAEVEFKQALVHRPGYVDAQWDYSLLLLKQGRLNEGWPLYETRYNPQRTDRNVSPPNLPFPQWQGEDLHGKSILLVTEQGYGDEIQFCRYAALLRARGACKITIVCKQAMEPLLRTLQDVDAILAFGEGVHQVPEHDFWAFPLSLPLHCGSTLDNLPASVPYLSALQERIAFWHRRIPAVRGMRVGLVWRGFTDHKNDAQRSLDSLAVLKPLWQVPGVTFISLQKGAGEEEAMHPPAGQALLHLGSDIRDFGDTAAIIAQLDLLITVDTAAAHVAGALGKPVWVMLPAKASDWRWLREREDSPWYPGVMRLFRQPRPGDWTTVLEAMVTALSSVRTTHSETPAQVRAVSCFEEVQNMKETSKAVMRRIHDHRFATRYFVGDGIDIGAGGDPLSLYRAFFPAMRTLRAWDIADGDAQLMNGVADASCDFVHSSHCLEHLHDPQQALRNWLRILKPGGHLVCLVPDEDLYEQGVFPSTFNSDHKWTFTLWKPRSWHDRSLNLLDMLQKLGEDVEVLKLELLDATYRYALPRFDQTLTPVGESAIEFVLRKRPEEEIRNAGRLPVSAEKIDARSVFLLTGLKMGN